LKSIKKYFKTDILNQCRKPSYLFNFFYLIEISISDEIIDGIVTSLISGIGDNKSFHFRKNQVNIPSLVFFLHTLPYDKQTVPAPEHSK